MPGWCICENVPWVPSHYDRHANRRGDHRFRNCLRNHHRYSKHGRIVTTALALELAAQGHSIRRASWSAGTAIVHDGGGCFRWVVHGKPYQAVDRYNMQLLHRDKRENWELCDGCIPIC